MLLDTSFNAVSTVLKNVHHSLLEVATKCLEYLKCLEGIKQPRTAVIISKWWRADQHPRAQYSTQGVKKLTCKFQDTIEDLSALAFAMMKSKRNTVRHPQYQCAVSKGAVRW